MTKQCRECRTTTSDAVPYCEACGCQFRNVPPLLLHRATWKGRLVAIISGLFVAVITQALHSERPEAQHDIGLCVRDSPVFLHSVVASLACSEPVSN